MPDQVLLGARLRAARLARGMTLQNVADAAGISVGFVSRLERDQVSPSVASLVAVCAAVGLRMGDLFEAPRSHIVRAGEGAPLNFGGRGATEQVITPGDQLLVQVIHARIERGGTGGDDLYTLDTRVEFVYVLRGRLVLQLGPETHELAAGDAMTFTGRDPHTWRNGADEECEVLWVLSPAP